MQKLWSFVGDFVMTTNSGQIKVGKKTVVVSFKSLHQNWPEEVDENHETLKSLEPII
jgi:hypothetical protein